MDTGALEGAARQVEAALQAGAVLPSAGIDGILHGAQQQSGHPFLFVDMARRMAGASSPPLSAARIRNATPGGMLSLDVGDGGQQAGLELRGAPVRSVMGRDGQPAGHLYMLPVPEAHGLPGGHVLLAPWVLTTAAIAIIALVLTFALSRRILQPVSALTAAAVRMTRGDLDVRVEARGSDEIAELSRAFNVMAGRIGETERLRRQMVSDVAHELRSPVTNLRCTLESIQDGLAAPDKQNIGALHDETLFLQRLIGDLQELALADAGHLELHRERVDVAAVVRSAAAPLASVRDSAPIAIEVEPELPGVHGDADRLEQVIRNLLNNARTHTPPDGAVTVHIGRAGNMVRVEVRDTGRGISPEDLPHVFDRFYRADRSRARATGGAGLGLAIARQLVASHGGSLTASSEGLNRGATFAVFLPVMPD